jgi:ABC-type transport system substrate-binding protein
MREVGSPGQDGGVKLRRAVGGALALALLLGACSGSDAEPGLAGSSVTPTSGDPDAPLTPERGGSLVFAREAETANPWTPAGMLCETACGQAARGIYDPLVTLDADYEVHPFLLESFTPNATFDEWTFTVRDDIRFHDGTPFDAAALADNLERQRQGPVGSASLRELTGIEVVDDRSVVISTAVPWPGFPRLFGGQPGFMASPRWLAAVDAGEAEATEPVGTGPFVFAEYQPGAVFRMTRNEDYWLEAPDGLPYPYLDEITFVVHEDAAARARSVVTGDYDMTHTTRGTDLADLREEAEAGEVELFEMTERPLASYALINLANVDSPLQDRDVRRAVAQAIDRETLSQYASDGIFPVANGPFAPGMLGHLDDTGFPEFDPEAAAAVVARYEADHGPVELDYRTTPDPDNIRALELIQQNLGEVGIDMAINRAEQTTFINDAALGNFELFSWRGHGAVDPALERGWHSELSAPVGQLSVNFGRLEDPMIDQNLDILRQVPDEQERQEAAEAITRRFGEEVYEIFYSWTYWTVAHQPHVHGVQTPLALPDGTDSLTQGIAGVGVVNVAQLWVDG